MRTLNLLLTGITMMLVTVIACEKGSIEAEELQLLQQEELLAKSDKVTICHYDDGYVDVFDEFGIKTGTEYDHEPEWVTINISVNALEKHRKHGDKYDWDEDGYYPENECSIGENLGYDCDNDKPEVNPGVDETAYDGIDNDCNPSTLDDDLDEDGYNLIDDCDDNDASVYPGAEEICGDGVDNDCDSISSDWNLVGTSVITFGQNSKHDMTIVSVTGNYFEGTGGYPSGANTYDVTWVVTGTFTNSEINSMYLDYNNSIYWVSITSGYIDSNGKLSGTANTQVGTIGLPWTTTEGAATCY